MEDIVKSSTILALGATALIACAGESRQAQSPTLTSAPTGATPATQEQAVPWPTLGNGTARFIRIDIGRDTFEACQRISPKFPFNSADALAQDRQQLEALAACLNSNGMRDRTLLLVGRADPAGTDAYNDELGMKRANAIKQILIENGIAESRITVATEGERAARGDTADQSAGYDRRVDIVVKGGVHAP